MTFILRVGAASAAFLAATILAAPASAGSWAGMCARATGRSGRRGSCAISTA